MRKTIAFHHAKPPSLDAQAGEVEMAAARSLGYLGHASRLRPRRPIGVQAPSAPTDLDAPASLEPPDANAPRAARL